MSAPDRKMLLDREHPILSIRRQCGLLGLARSGVYRPSRIANDDELAIMRRLDELFLAWPFFGSRRMTAMLRADGWIINRKRVRRLMRVMGLRALGPKPNTSKPAPGHKIYPYLLRDLVIDRPNQVWCADITYIPMGRGFLYLVAIMDWATRKVLAWRVSNTLHADFCIEALEEALARHGPPEIFNTPCRHPRTARCRPPRWRAGSQLFGFLAHAKPSGATTTWPASARKLEMRSPMRPKPSQPCM